MKPIADRTQAIKRITTTASMDANNINAWASVASAIASAVSAIGAFLVYRMGRKAAASDRVVSAWETFQTAEFHEQRSLAWQALARWFKDPNFQKAFLDGAHPSNRDDLFHWPGDDDPVYSRQWQALWRVLEFFNTLADDEFSKEEIVMRYGFYAEWWLPGLLDITNKFEERYEAYIIEHARSMGSGNSEWELTKVRRHFPQARWIKGIRKLEIIFYGGTLNIQEHPLYKSSSPANSSKQQQCTSPIQNEP